MEYCNRCVYPANARPGLILDDEGVCSGCRLIESRGETNWEERERMLRDIFEEARARQREKGSPFDCIIPVSGGKDSTFQTWLVKKKFGLNPLLVSYNHTFNTPLGVRNLSNLIEKMDCNLVRFTTAPGSAKRIAKYMIKKVGDVTWHYHAGIQTFPIQAAVQYEIPLMVWGEEGFSELVGMHNVDDFVEFTKKKRQEHSMRGFEPEDLLEEADCELTPYDLAPFFYPSDEDIERVGLRGIYLSNFIPWNARKQTEFIIDELGFETAQFRERTFNLYDKLDDIHANGFHDYLKYLKFGYGRATDDAATEVRQQRMTREQAIEMVAKYDHVRPSDMDIFLEAVGLTEEEVIKMIEPMRDPAIWARDENGNWFVKDSVAGHVNDPGVEKVRLSLKENTKPFFSTPEKISAHSQKAGEQVEYVVL